MTDQYRKVPLWTRKALAANSSSFIVVKKNILSLWLVGTDQNKPLTLLSSVADPDLNPDPYVLGLPDPDPLVWDTDPDPDPSIIKEK